jgi:hypothetical protein
MGHDANLTLLRLHATEPSGWVEQDLGPGDAEGRRAPFGGLKSERGCRG